MQKSKENFWIPYADLMTVLMVIFLFISLAYMGLVEYQKKQQDKIFEEYNFEPKNKRIYIASLNNSRLQKAQGYKMKTIESKLVLEFQNAGFNFFSGVPCGMIKPLLNELEKTVSNKNFCYLPREDICLGVACGAYLAGMKPVVLMQNSGLGHSINALASLIIPLKILQYYLIYLLLQK